MNNYLNLSIVELHNLLLKGEVKPSTLVLEAIEKCKNDEFNALEALNFDEALKKAYELDKKEVPDNNYFFGIPYIAKDNLSTKGLETTGGSNILKGYVPSFDATVISILNSLDAIMVAKSTLDELAMGGSGRSGHKGLQYNPFDKTKMHLIGGSSSGSAVATAASYVPFALGSDTGDSIRKPASYGGLVGYKPTYGLISRFGLFPFSVSLDHVGYFTRSVEDAAILFDALNKYDENDYTSSLKERTKVCPLDEKEVKKVAVINEVISSIKDEKILNSFKNYVQELENRGVKVDYVNVDSNLLKAIYPSYIIISSAEATSNNANLDGVKFGNRKEGKTYQEVMFNTRNEGFGELIKRRFILGSYALMKENQEEVYLKAKRIRHAIVDTFNNILDEYDAFIAPAAPSVARKVNEDSDALDDTYLIADNFLAIGNFGGYPSITIPLGLKEGLPFGLSITSKIFADKKCFEVAKLSEDIIGLKGLSTSNVDEFIKEGK